MLGVSTRNYERSLEPARAGMSTRGASHRAVSRRFVNATSDTVNEMMGRDLSGLAMCALIIDGSKALVAQSRRALPSQCRARQVRGSDGQR